MDERYYVAVSRGEGMIGCLTAAEIRARLVAAFLLPTFVCAPADPGADRRWRPLWAVFGLPRPDGAPDDPPPGADPEAYAVPPVAPRPVAAERPGPRPPAVGDLLLTFGQVASFLACVAIPIYAGGAVSAAAAVRDRVPGAPNPTFWIVSGAVLSFLYSAAMFVVFTRCNQIPMR